MTTSIEDKYELALTPIAIGGKRLEIYIIANWDPFIRDLESSPETSIKRLPFWVKVWEASIILTDHLMGMDLGKKRRVLEIGAGMGIIGLFLGYLGHEVCITDCEEDALALAEMNARHNRLDNVCVKRLDWDNPGLKDSFDIICGSELIYNEISINPIMRLLHTYLRPDGTVFLAHDVKRKCFMQFIGMVQGRFEVENVVKRLSSKEEVHRILVHRLKLKGRGS